jgi:hypothetical protein
MGFHVHVDVSTLQNSQLVKLCQNFIKYEEVVDSLLPPSRRTGSEESNRFFRSNRESVPGSDNRERILALSRCEDVNSLAALMNGNNTDVSPRYYKLNLQNLVTGRQPTVEFRQHSATVKYPKVNAWIRLCMALVENSAKLAPPRSFQEDRSLSFQWDALFQYVIKDRALRDYYKQRALEVVGAGAGAALVVPCACHGHGLQHQCHECQDVYK